MTSKFMLHVGKGSRVPRVEWTLENVARVSSSLRLPLREILRHDEGAEFGRWILFYWNDTAAIDVASNAPPRREKILWIDFEIIEGIACQIEKTATRLEVGGPDSGPVMFYATEDREIFGPVGTDMTTLDLNKAVWSVRGFVKVDGCTQIYIPNGHIHADSHDELRGLFSAIARAQARCYEIYDAQEATR